MDEHRIDRVVRLYRCSAAEDMQGTAKNMLTPSNDRFYRNGELDTRWDP